MKPWMLAVIGALAATAASAQPDPRNPATTTICLEGGRSVPASCKAPASRLDGREDICLCINDGVAVTAPVCPPGVKPPVESVAYQRARRAAVSHGSLVGATYEGQPMCVAPRVRSPR